MIRLQIPQTFLMAIVLFVFSMSIKADVPQVINYQGRLTGSGGNPVSDGSYEVIFTIYDASAGGNSKWTETKPISTSNGLFAVVLGTINPIIDTVFNEATRYLGLAVAGDPELSPRTVLVSVPYAQRVSTIDGASGGDVVGDITLSGQATFGPSNTNTGDNSFVFGKSNNASGDNTIISGGWLNTASGMFQSTVSGGAQNTSSHTAATVGGGQGNTASSTYSTVGGGFYNTAGGSSATVSGGYQNVAGGDYSFTIGYADTIDATGDYSVLFGIGSKLTQDSTFMIDMPHVRIGNETDGFELPIADGTTGQIMTTNGSGQVSWSAPPSGGSGNWTESGGVLFTNGVYGIARLSNTIFGIDNDSTHINLGVNSTTGAFGFDYRYLTISGGYMNTASGELATIGGGANNSASDSATISGGYNNTASGNLATIGGGRTNLANGDRATIGGGSNNHALDTATVGGGYTNNAGGIGATISGGSHNEAGGIFATVGGGNTNSADSAYSTVSGGFTNSARGNYATVSGGYTNSADSAYSTVSGGSTNNASGNSATIGGGYNNSTDSAYSTISGGISNTSNGLQSTVGGGFNNVASGESSTVSGGNTNTASGLRSTVGGGFTNAATGSRSSVVGGLYNDADGMAATVCGGYQNDATGDFSFAAGHRAKAIHEGSFVWADANAGQLASSGPNQFTARASGGVRFFTHQDDITGVYVNPGSGTWSSVSDSTLKENIQPVDGNEILEKLAKLKVSRWNYKTQDESIQHIGPMAQDFHRLFGVGDNNTSITTIDPDGIALAAAKQLALENQELKERLKKLEELVAQLIANE